MEKLGDMELYTLEECLDENFGPVGTGSRDAFDMEVRESVDAYFLRETMRIKMEGGDESTLMETYEELEPLTLGQSLDKRFGPIGTACRDEFEAKVAESLHAHHMGETIRQARLSKNLTQQQLGEMIGVKRSQVSRIENGDNLSFTTLRRIFRALKVPATIDVAGVGRVALW